MRLKYFLSVILFLAFLGQVFCQLGSTHYIPPLHGQEPINNNEVFIYMSTPNPVPFRVNILLGNGTVLGSVTISDGAPANFNTNVGGTSVLNTTTAQLNTVLNNKGVILEGEGLFYASVRLRAVNSNHSGYLVAKGEDALGTRFRVGSCPLTPGGLNNSLFTSIMAFENNTQIIISDFDPTMVFQGGTLPGVISLNAGETFVISAYENSSPANREGFIGALIEADKPVIVNTGNLATNLPDFVDSGGATQSTIGNDLMLDQIVDESLIGYEYMLVRGRGLNVLERPMVIATVPNTDIFVNGTFFATIANPGDYLFLNPEAFQPAAGPHRNMYVTSDDPSDPTDAQEPFYMYQFLGGGTSTATPGLIFVPPLSCFFQNDVNSIPNLNNITPTVSNYFGDIAITAFTGTTVTYNGAPPPTAALANPATTDWVTYLVTIPTAGAGDGVIIADGPIAVGYIGSDGSSAGFGGYYSGFAVNPEDTETDVCTLGGPIDLVDRIDGNPAGTGTWTPPLNSGGNIFDPMIDPAGVYVYEELGACANIIVDVTVTLVNSPDIDEMQLPDLTVCEADNFMLADPAMIMGANLSGPQYYTDTQASGTATLIDWTTEIFNTIGTQTIYVYDETRAEPDNCTDEVSFTITVNETPDATTNDPEVCAGVTSAPIIVTPNSGVPVNYTIDYDPIAEGQGFADVGAGTLPMPVTLTMAEYTIPSTANPGVYNGILTYYDAAGCTGTDSFTITIFENPEASTNDATVCQGVTSEEITITPISGMPQNYSIDYDAVAEAQGFVDVASVTMPDPITGAMYVIPAAGLPGTYNGILTYIDANGCQGTDDFTITINENPEAETNDTSVCQGETSTPINVTPSTGTPISYFIDYDAFAEGEGFVDAGTAMAPLPLAGANYVIPALGAVGDYNGTITYLDANGCSGTDTFTITIDRQPQATAPAAPLEECDDATGGNDTNGITEFDLTTFNLEILDGQNQAEVQITFHESAINAIDDMSPVGPLYTNTTANQQTIYVRVENIDNENCFATTQFEIIVNPLPVVTDVTLEQCDDDTDGFAIFNLQEANILISADAANETFTYFETEINAIDDMSPIMMDTAYPNQVAINDVVWARIETQNNCVRTARVDLQVSTSQIPPGFEISYEVCDNDNDGDASNGLANFNFANATPQIIALFPPADRPNLIVTYYNSIADASSEIDAIMDISNFDNTVANQQFLTVRVDNVTNNSCAGLEENAIVLNVIGNPEANTMVDDYDLCDEDNDLIEIYDLRSLETEILDGLSTADYSVVFYDDPTNAENEMSPITNDSMYPFNPGSTPALQTLFARVTNESTADRCFIVIDFDIVLNPDPIVNTPSDLLVCDDTAPDGFTTINLTLKNDEIKGVNTTGVTVTYHLDQMGADDADLSIVNPTMFVNTTNPQTVIARVTNNSTLCFDTIPLRVEVLQAPSVFAPTPYELCDPDNDDSTTFMLSSKNDEIRAGNPTLVITYYRTQAEAEADPPNVTNALDQNIYTNNSNPETVWARVENAGGCATVVPVELIVLDTPMP
ncbi:IgGFc-binding protein, partial [Dokdonia sinensis]